MSDFGKVIVRAYFAEHPEAWDGVKKATYAYHFHLREARGAHNFISARRDAACAWCGRTRELVRWDDAAPECAKRPAWADEMIESVVAREEAQFEKVFAKAAELAAAIDVSALSGEDLARVHHTYGVDPSMLEAALMAAGRELPQRLHDEYQLAYQAHRETGRRGLVREVIMAKTAEEVA